MDNRGGRVLEKDRRSIFDDEERDWVWDKAKGDFDHLLIGASDPFLLTHSFHWLEAWNEKVVEGKAWGRAPRSSARRCAARSTSTTGRRSASRSTR